MMGMQDPTDAIGAFMVEMRTAIADAAFADEASVNSPIDPSCS